HAQRALARRARPPDGIPEAAHRAASSIRHPRDGHARALRRTRARRPERLETRREGHAHARLPHRLRRSRRDLLGSTERAHQHAPPTMGRNDAPPLSAPSPTTPDKRANATAKPNARPSAGSFTRAPPAWG